MGNQTTAFVMDAVDVKGNTQASFSISSTAAQSSALDSAASYQAGLYDVWADVDCYIKVATTANDVTVANGYLLRANNTIPVVVRPGDKIGAITVSASGTLYFHKVGQM